MAISNPSPWSDNVEAYFTHLGLKFERMMIKLGAIDKAHSQGNNARVGNAVLPDTVAFYAEAKKRGDIFPAAWGYVSGDLVILLDGNQRYEADLKVGSVSMPIYIIEDPTTDDIARLTAEANATNGAQSTMEDRVALAYFLVQSRGVTKIAAADIVRIPVDRLISYSRIRTTYDRLRKLKVPPAKIASNNDRAAAIKSDKVLERAILIADRLGTAGFDRLVKDINHAPTEADQIAVVEFNIERLARESAPASLTHARNTNTPYRKLSKFVQFATVLPEAREIAEIPKAQQPIIRKRLVDVALKIELLIEELAYA